MNSSRRTIRSRAAGFTLIEVLVTLGMMAIVLPAAMRGVSIATASASYARHAAEAATLGQSKLNEIVSNLEILQTNDAGSSGDFGQTWPGYTWTYQDSYDADLTVTTITLIVNWQERGQDRSIELSTMVADPAATTDTTTGT